MAWMAAGQSGEERILRKDFFFEKKKQKTFECFPPGDVAKSRVKVAKVFCGARVPMAERSEG